MNYLQQLAPYFPDVEIFLQTAGQQQPVSLNGISQVAGMEMLTIIDEILYCTYPAVIRKKYLSYKVKETLILALQKIVHPPSQKAIYLPEKIASRIYEAREILSKNLNTNHTLADLSGLVGLSIYNLKKGFKIIYGLTVTDFLHEARMQKARLLLSETDLPVSRIAAATGYTHPFAFSSAFKKYFGYTPSLVQKSRKQTFVYS
jgi:AraC family transcriptional activator of pyochelin receptor